jgi:DnaJ-class molecular chaperone
LYVLYVDYRKAAQKWHPDNFQGDEKKMAEKKFIDIAAAKEVLTDQGGPCFIFSAN